MASTRARPNSTASSLMQDVPGAFPAQGVAQDEECETITLTLSQAVHVRRAEYIRPKYVRIKVGTWNVAAYKGAEKDVGAWFVDGKGVAEGLAGLEVRDEGEREDVAEQEARYARKKPTVPRGDTGALPGQEQVGLYVLGLQEVVDVGSVTEALRPFNDPGIAGKWKVAMTEALPAGYQLVAEQQLIGMMLLIYASADVTREVRAVSTTSVGSGIGGFMGNKGAVTARIVLGDTTRLVFINSHMSAGADKASLERRNWDAQQIVQRTRFDPIHDAMDLQQTTGEQIGEEDFAFWMGDLNYRLEGIPGDDVRRLLMLHTRNEYDLSQRSARKIERELATATNSVKRRVEHRTSVSSAGSGSTTSPRASSDGTRTSTESTAPTLIDEVAASDDPTSLQTTLSSLLPHDELHQQMNSGKAFHDGWREGPITFLPTYKYDAGSVGVFDSSEKKRAPSWCDRILYRTRRDRLAYEAKIRDEENARKKDEEMRANGTDQAGNDEEILFDYDPETDAAGPTDEYDEYDELDDGVVMTKEGFEDEIKLEYYTAHQRVLSSDHKPLDAVFILKYDSVVPELKAKVHAEVARDLDKAENETRPSITVVVDKHHDGDVETSDADPANFEGVWFSDVRWAHTKHRTITIANTGRVSASFTFIERPVPPGDPHGIAPRWINLKIHGTAIASSCSTTAPIALEPGDSCTVELELRILDIHTVHQLNDSRRSLDDILVLRVEGGRDHFVPIRGHWLDTSLGRSIDKLTRLPEGGIRRLQQQKPDSSNPLSKGRSRPSSSVGSPTAEAHAAFNRATDPGEGHPVRFSAPRELFRLTEAIEELVTRVVAEWDMTRDDSAQLDGDGSATAPWIEHPGWPFDKECWHERTTDHWTEALGDATNALDMDRPLEASMSAELPKMQRLYVLASLLLLFLSSMPDGVITEDIWSRVEAYLVQGERAKRKPPIEDQRTSMQEILAHEPGHNISFMLLTSMLERIMQEVVSVSKQEDDVVKSPSGKRPGGTLRRMTARGKLPQEPRTEQTRRALGLIFADVVIRTPAAASEKTKKEVERRKAEVMETFLKREDPG